MAVLLFLPGYTEHIITSCSVLLTTFQSKVQRQRSNGFFFGRLPLGISTASAFISLLMTSTIFISSIIRPGVFSPLSSPTFVRLVSKPGMCDRRGSNSVQLLRKVLKYIQSSKFTSSLWPPPILVQTISTFSCSTSPTSFVPRSS